MNRPEIRGWIIDSKDHGPLQQPLYAFTSHGGYDNIPFFHNYTAAQAQLTWLEKMYPDSRWVIAEATLTTEHAT